MLKILVIDDEEGARYSIRHIVNEHCPSVEVVGEADGVASGLEQIKQHKPDLVILDIHLKDGSGFDLLRSLDVIRFKVMFVTAYDKYAVQAIKFSALDFFLKPVDPNELAAALNQYASNNESQNSALKLNAFFTNLMPDFEGSRKIVLEGDSGIFLINIDDIVGCEGIGHQTSLALKNSENITINKPLKEFKEIFSNSQIKIPEIKN